MPAGVHLERQFNARLNEETHALLAVLANQLNTTKTEIIERAVKTFYGAGRSTRVAVLRYRADRMMETDGEDA